MNLHFRWRRIRLHFDWGLAILAGLVSAVGVTNLYSATRHVAQGGLFAQQLVWLAVGLTTFLGLSAIDYRVWLRIAWLGLLVCLVAVVVVHVSGVAANGSRRWLGWGSFRLQPSELVKLAAILALARFVHDQGGETLAWPAVASRVALFLVAVVMIVWQPDLGTAALVALVCGTVAFLAWHELWPVGAGLAALGLVAAGALASPWRRYFLHDYQKDRLLAFLDSSADPSGISWQTRQSIFAIGSGRFTGKGFLHGTQNRLNFLPEQWTDFPFSVWAEEWGFVGSVVLLFLYLFLILWIVNIASQARDRFGQTICLGVAALLFWHVVVNIAMTTGLAPVVGVTLPLVSYGGSNVITMFLGLGLVGSVSIRRYAG